MQSLHNIIRCVCKGGVIVELSVKFINCTAWEFDGKKGITCRCYDPQSNSIIKVKSHVMLDNAFGDDVVVKCVPNGRYLNYEV